MAIISVRGLYKSFHHLQVLQGIDLDIKEKETVVLIGRSGCGKSTLLRCLNGLETFDRGKLTVGGLTLERPLKAGSGETEKSLAQKVNKVRLQTGMVFQSFNLFPHLTVLQNLMLAPTVVKNSDPSQAEVTALNLLRKVGLETHAHHYPAQLSGGQSQRAAIARALAMAPQIMLYDEPTSALDPELVDEVLDVMKKLSEEGLTQIVVTHEMRFARDVADRVIHLDAGKIVDDACPDVMFKQPKDERTKKFLSKYL